MSATNVQFSVAVHIMTGLGYLHGESVTSGTLAQSVKADPGFVRRSLSKLVKAKLVTTTRGKNGACSLSRPPDQITLLDVYRASGAPPAFAIHGYPEESRCAISLHIKPCLQRLLDNVQSSVEETLSKITVADLVADIRGRCS